MLAAPPELASRYEARLAQQNVIAGQCPHYHKWLRYYYDGLTSAIKVRHYSPKTLQAYQIWMQKFQTFTRSNDPRQKL